MERIKQSDLRTLAERCGLTIQGECGGFRVVTPERADVFPNGGVCPTATKRACWTFLSGYAAGMKHPK